MAEPMNFSWFVEEKVAGLACPGDDGVTFLANQGITTIVNLSDRPRVPRYTEKARVLGIRVEAIPIVEFTAPTVQQIERFLQILNSATEVCNRNIVVMQCGRVALCLIIINKHDGAGPCTLSYLYI